MEYRVLSLLIWTSQCLPNIGIPTAALSDAMNQPIAPTLANAMPIFSWFFIGRFSALESSKPWSFPNATRDPVKVTPPIKVPRKIAALWTFPAGSSGKRSTSARYLAMAVSTAARPTKLWKAATSWGRSLTAMRLEMMAPIVPPTPIMAAICVRTSWDGASAPIVAVMPVPMPMIPTTQKLHCKLTETCERRRCEMRKCKFQWRCDHGGCINRSLKHFKLARGLKGDLHPRLPS